MPAVITWTSIPLLHHVVGTYQHLNIQDGLPFPTVSYKGKVKLHGINCGVQVREEGIFAQSRGDLLTLPSGDLKGFARWVETHRSYWEAIEPGITVFGEWCGPGVQKKAAISKGDRKVYAVFAAQVGYGEEARIVYDPEALRALLPVAEHPDVFILPWFEPATVTLNYADETQMAGEVAKLNTVILNIEAEDPWVKEMFGISGVGEGVVMYPMGEHASTDSERLGRTMFKAKGKKHAVKDTKEPVQIAPEVIASIEEFVAVMVTDNRLEQGLLEACDGEAHMKHTRAFLIWVTTDVEKESVAELEAADLTWEQVMKPVQGRARTWLRGRVVV
jgi:hypothetical protein